MKNNKIRPSMRWYVLSAAIVIVGALCSLGVFLYLFVSIVNSTKQIVVPGIHRLKLMIPGKYIIFHEYQSVVGDKIFSTDKNLISDLKCSVHTLDGEQIVVSLIPPYETYNLGGRIKGYSAFKFKIDQSGTYVLNTEYENKKGEPQIVLGIQRPLKEQILIPGLLLTSFSTSTILVAACIFWITFFKRRRAKKRLFV